MSILAILFSNDKHTSLAEKDWDKHAPVGTGGGSLEHARACSFGMRGCLNFFGQDNTTQYNAYSKPLRIRWQDKMNTWRKCSRSSAQKLDKSNML